MHRMKAFVRHIKKKPRKSGPPGIPVRAFSGFLFAMGRVAVRLWAETTFRRIPSVADPEGR